MKVLLINPSNSSVYERTSIHFYKGISKENRSPFAPPLSLAVIASPLIQSNHTVKIFDMNVPSNDMMKLTEELNYFAPDFVGITFSTPQFNEAKRLIDFVKGFNPKIFVVAGGVHVSAFPEQSLNELQLDAVIVGEGDFALKELIEAKNLKTVKGIVFREKEKLFFTGKREFIHNLDSLPFPAWNLFDITQYFTPKTNARKSPAGWIETSRGCLGNCSYCTKTIHGKTFRTKSPERVFKEMKAMKEYGFNEIHIADDACTTDLNRMKELCRMLIANGIHTPWATVTGIRVNPIDEELMYLMKFAGCYRVYFGIESGNQDILNGIKKGITLKQVRKAVDLSKKAGMEVVGFFMLALPNETEKTMQGTIDFAKSLNLDFAKTSITIPLPSTKMFQELKEKGLIKEIDYSDFEVYSSPRKIYNHENMDWDLVEKYYKKFYKEFYFRPKFMTKKVMSSIFHGTFLSDLKVLAKSGIKP